MRTRVKHTHSMQPWWNGLIKKLFSTDVWKGNMRVNGSLAISGSVPIFFCQLCFRYMRAWWCFSSAIWLKTRWCRQEPLKSRWTVSLSDGLLVYAIYFFLAFYRRMVYFLCLRQRTSYSMWKKTIVFIISSRTVSQPIKILRRHSTDCTTNRLV